MTAKKAMFVGRRRTSLAVVKGGTRLATLSMLLPTWPPRTHAMSLLPPGQPLPPGAARLFAPHKIISIYRSVLTFRKKQRR